MIDFLSIVPFDLFINPGNYNDSIRLTRIGKMYISQNDKIIGNFENDQR